MSGEEKYFSFADPHGFKKTVSIIKSSVAYLKYWFGRREKLTIEIDLIHRLQDRKELGKSQFSMQILES